MKNTLRLLTFLLTICLIFSSFSSCGFLSHLIFEDSTETESESTSLPTETESESTSLPAETETDNSCEDPAPMASIPGLEYTYTEQDYTNFTDLLARVEALILQDRSADADVIDPLLEELEDLFYHIATQGQIAYIYYCMDLTNETFSNAYLESSAASSNAFEAYQQMCLRIDQSDAPYRDAFFADWTEEDLDEMRSFDPMMTQLSQQNDALVVEYHDLTDKKFNSGTRDIFYRMIQNNNQIAKLNGYDFYPEYAYEKVYHRDYSPEDSRRMHQLIGTYITRLCEQSLETFRSVYAEMDYSQKVAFSKLVGDDYRETGNAITAYIASYPEESGIKENMGSLFENDNAIFTDSENAREGAFTGFLYEYEKPICYFGPGYQSLYTITHEMGHYYAFLMNGSDEIRMDLAETQSQGNEWMLTTFIAAKLDEKIARALISYQLYDATATIIMSALVDAFEQEAYTQNLTAVIFDKEMERICESFGGMGWIRTNLGDPLDYWKHVVVENPCYYISYAFSMLASLELFVLSQSDYAGAQEAYLAIAQANPEPGELLEFFVSVGIQSPLEEGTYQNLIRNLVV